MLASLQKNFTIDELRRTARIVKDFGIRPCGSSSRRAGRDRRNDTETFEFIDSCISAKDMVHMTFGLRIYPGTGLHRRAIEEGMVDENDPLTATRFLYIE